MNFMRKYFVSPKRGVKAETDEEKIRLSNWNYARKISSSVTFLSLLFAAILEICLFGQTFFSCSSEMIFILLKCVDLRKKEGGNNENSELFHSKNS